MNLFWAITITAASVAAGTSLCYYLLQRAQGVDSTVWILQHILCPIIRIIVLLIVVSQVYPGVGEQTSSADFWQILGRQGQFSDLINILFIAGLLLAFIPVLNHPVFALPIQGMLTIALVFHWQFLESAGRLQLFPSVATLLKIIGYMTLAYFVTRELSVPISRWLDRSLVISGSIRLVSDALYMVLQIPVMLIYCSFLRQQLT